jgi:enamine deaminase RidA (YjgF/YER057c/UK114 family)
VRLDYVTSDRLESQPDSWWHGVLGVVGFARPPATPIQVPSTSTMTPPLAADAELYEVWRLPEPGMRVVHGSTQRGRVHYRGSEDVLFGCLSFDEESDVPDDATDAGQALLRAAEAAYDEIFAVLDATQHRHLIRIWNYVPAINALAAGEERYRLFNSARQAAFRKSGRATMGSVPAACALGSPAGSPICIYFLAARRPPRVIENPRQTSAYHYPPKFGRHSPTFSRACISSDSPQANLFISGTASIVGHETVHSGDVAAQTRETLANINALLGEANRAAGAARYSLETLKLKVYVRHASDLGAIQAVLSRELHGASPVYLQADICREDLLVEIEAVGGMSGVSPNVLGAALRQRERNQFWKDLLG